MDIPLSKGFKSLGKIAGVVGNIFNVIDSFNFGVDIREKNYAIEHIVYYHLGDAIRSNTREGVEIKYTYAYFAVKDLIDGGVITYRYDDMIYWVDGWKTEKNQLIKEINRLDYYLTK